MPTCSRFYVPTLKAATLLAFLKGSASCSVWDPQLLLPKPQLSSSSLPQEPNNNAYKAMTLLLILACCLKTVLLRHRKMC